MALNPPQRFRLLDFIAERIANANNVRLIEALGIDDTFRALETDNAFDAFREPDDFFHEPQESLREPLESPNEPQESFINFFVETSQELSDT